MRLAGVAPDETCSSGAIAAVLGKARACPALVAAKGHAAAEMGILGLAPDGAVRSELTLADIEVNLCHWRKWRDSAHGAYVRVDDIDLAPRIDAAAGAGLRAQGGGVQFRIVQEGLLRRASGGRHERSHTL